MPRLLRPTCSMRGCPSLDQEHRISHWVGRALSCEAVAADRRPCGPPEEGQSQLWVMDHGRSEPLRVLKIARSIDAAWFRCQALASVALDLRDSESTREVVTEAMNAAFSLSDPVGVVCVSSWPVRAMVRSNHPDLRQARKWIACKENLGPRDFLGAER